MNFEKLLNGVPLGIALGLVVGKSLGVFAFAQVAIKFGWAKFPDGVDSRLLFGVAMLCGIGFTMSFFIGGLAFAEGGGGYSRIDRLGIIVGSLVSAIAGYLCLRQTLMTRTTSTAVAGDL